MRDQSREFREEVEETNAGSGCFGRSELLGWLWRGFEGGEEESFSSGESLLKKVKANLQRETPEGNEVEADETDAERFHF